MAVTVKVIPDFNDVIDGKKFFKGVEKAYPIYLINAIKNATHPDGTNAYPLKFAKEKKEEVKKDGK